jgi:hypothetical protein
MFTVNTARVEYNQNTHQWGVRLNVEIDEEHKECYYLKAIYITNQDYYYDDVWDEVWKNPNEDYSIYSFSDFISEDIYHPNLSLDHVCIKDDLIFIKIEVAFKEKECTPEVIGCDSEGTLILNVFNVKNIYDRYIQHIKEVNVCCDIPKAFIDFYLRYEAFKVAVITGNYASAIKMYRALMGKENRSNNINSCGCGRVHR